MVSTVCSIFLIYLEGELELPELLIGIQILYFLNFIIASVSWLAGMDQFFLGEERRKG